MEGRAVGEGEVWPVQEQRKRESKDSVANDQSESYSSKERERVTKLLILE